MTTCRARLRVGIVGLGMMGHSLAETCRAEPRAWLVAGCDVMASVRNQWAAAHDVAFAGMYDDADTMLQRADLDIVIVATHTPLHNSVTLAAAARGIHVFCEKPLAPCLRDADEMVAACEAAGVKLAVNHIKRGSRANDVVHALIADGVIGTPYLIRGEGKGGRWAGSELMEMGTHIFDWLRILAGDPHWIFARLTQNGRPAELSDIIHSLQLPYRERDCGLVLGERAFCSLGLPSGLHADIGFLSQSSGEDTGYGFDICGTEGTLALRRSLGTDLFVQRGRHRGPLAPPWEPIAIDEYAGLEPPVLLRGPDGERLALQQRLFGDFLDAIAEDREPCSSGRDGVLALELSMAVWESHLTGQPVALPLSDRSHPLERRQGAAGA